MRISPRFGHTGKIKYQHGHAFYHYRVIGGEKYRFGVFTYWLDGKKDFTRERV